MPEKEQGLIADIMEMIVVKTFDSFFSAHIILQKLKQEGIQCYLRDEHTVTIDPLLSNAIGGIKLAVAKPDVARALDLMEIFEKEALKFVACEICKKDGLEKLVVAGEPSLIEKLLTWILKSSFAETQIVYRCTHCHHETKHLPERYGYYNT